MKFLSPSLAITKHDFSAFQLQHRLAVSWSEIAKDILSTMLEFADFRPSGDASSYYPGTVTNWELGELSFSTLTARGGKSRFTDKDTQRIQLSLSVSRARHCGLS